jgi:hypothetical protein
MLRADGAQRVETRCYKMCRADGTFFILISKKGRSPCQYCNNGFQPVAQRTVGSGYIIASHNPNV